MPSPFDIVDSANREFEKLFNEGKLSELVKLYSDDGKLLPPDKNVYDGHEAIQKFWQGATAAGVKDIKLTTGNVLEAGDYLIETSSYKHSLDHGNFQVIWKKNSDGKWQLHIDIFN
ncbi:unnamed protein product [Didymodactylos carnosus]|uniref:DUF4440 domain-containing protein n=1 Tax=Didymodactylos carnosus TaxID=1234261 RepID=A0A813P765_9BILA|nr:unnamed protein product [Didymodactylos carnosus]CAF0744553.1 unnamed protein product [Didymodactylos carnosus]CAF3503268.1 unnamed protein product [Didymodactylos carnosus]CAF3523172.1 unnamed protein product [Didymodactylos carnosus]